MEESVECICNNVEESVVFYPFIKLKKCLDSFRINDLLHLKSVNLESQDDRNVAQNICAFTLVPIHLATTWTLSRSITIYYNHQC